MNIEQPPGARAGSSAREAFNQNVTVDIQQDGSVKRRANLIQEFFEVKRLLLRAWEAIEYEAARRIWLTKPSSDDFENNLIRNQVSGIYYCLGFPTDFGARSSSFAKHVTRRNLRNVFVRHQFFCLCALAGAGRAEQYYAHAFVPNYEIAQVRYRQ